MQDSFNHCLQAKHMTKQELRDYILDQFRKTNSRAGHILYMRTFRFGIMRRLNPEEQKLFVDAANELIFERLISFEQSGGGMDFLRLTELGYQALYAGQTRTDRELRDLLMNMFRDQNCKVGEIIPIRSITFNLMNTLNPMEQDRMDDVTNQLIADQFITYEDGRQGGLPCIRLQQRGYDYIYH